MAGRRVLISGGTAGLGKETALGLLKLGAEVIVVGRNPEKTRAVVEELKAKSVNPQVDFLLGDLSSLAEVRRVAGEFRRRFGRLNVLVNNVGATNFARELTVDGYERTFATNHLGYFLLTRELLPALEEGAPSRVVSVASSAHVIARDPGLADPMSTRGYSGWMQYGRSKLANILFARELARRVADKGITSNSLHPGFVASDFLDKPGFWRAIKPLAYLFALSPAKGALTSIYLASSPEVEGVTGEYFFKCKVRTPTQAARDDALAAKLWALSEELTGASASRSAA